MILTIAIVIALVFIALQLNATFDKESFGSGNGALIQLTASSGYYPFYRYGYGYQYLPYIYRYPYYNLYRMGFPGSMLHYTT